MEDKRGHFGMVSPQHAYGGSPGDHNVDFIVELCTPEK